MSVSAKIATLDFEASSFTGWPIEAGWMREGDAAPRSMLIRPDPSWRMDEWSQASAAVHGIALEMLRRHGFDPSAVLLALTRDLAGHIVVSDAPEADGAWLKRLCDVCGQGAPFELVSVNEVIPVLARRRGVEPLEITSRFIAEMYSDDVLIAHRAGPDAARLLRGLFGADADDVKAAHI